MTARVLLQAVRKNYGDVTAVDGFDLDIAAGEAVALLGPSGSGKSTVLRMIAGLEPVSAGRVIVGNRDVTHLPPGRRNVGMVFQEPATFPYLTVAENLAFGMKARHVPAARRRSRIDATADLLGIGNLLQRRPHQLSGGERQRVELGRALLRDPEVLLFDEPLSGLDAALRVELRGELSRIHREVGTTTIVVTHDQTEAMVLGDRVGVMRAGRLVQTGTPADLFERPADVFVATFVGSPPMNVLRARVEDGHARLAGLRLPLPHGASAEVDVGIRPADLVEAADADGFEARVVDIEDHGDSLVARCAVDGAGTVVVPMPRQTGVAPGQVLRLRPAHWHLFEPGTGLRLQWTSHDSPLQRADRAAEP